MPVQSASCATVYRSPTSPRGPSPAMPPHQSISLGTALFGFLPAPGCTVPDEQADAWVGEFVRQAPADVLWLLSQAGTAGRPYRDHVLRTAGWANLTLDATAGEPLPAWLQRVREAGDRLRTRGTLPTSIEVYLNRTPECVAASTACITLLQGAGPGVTELSVWFSPEPERAHPDHLIHHVFSKDAYTRELDAWWRADQADIDCTQVTAFTQLAAAAFPALTSLWLDGCSCALPPPAQLPQLAHVSFAAPTLSDTALISIAPHLTYLKSVHIGATHSPASIQWPLLFTTDTPTHTLTSFSTDQWLTDELVGLLLDNAPALTELSVRGVRCAGVHRDRVWGVEDLYIQTEGPESIGVSTLLGLPLCASDARRLCVHGENLREVKLEVTGVEVSHSPAPCHTQTDVPSCNTDIRVCMENT